MFHNSLIPILSALAMALFSRPSSAQEISDSLKSFDKIQVSPFINLVLQEGETEHIRMEYTGIEPEKINYSVKGKKLRIFLNDAKYTGKTEEIIENGYRQKVPVYRDVKVTAYVTYQSLEGIEIRGEERVVSKDSLVGENLKIRLFGESEADFAYVQVDRLKVRAFGENELTIRSGKSGVVKIRLFGENEIQTSGMDAGRISSSFFGENDLVFHANEKINMWGLGEVNLRYSGRPTFRKFIIGESEITEW